MHNSVLDDTCPFCRIVDGDLAAEILYEDDRTVAFLDITAVMEGHTLVIPKKHSVDIWDITLEDLTAVTTTVHRMAGRIRDVLKPDGLTLFQANRAAGWQDVFHLHVHLVPRRDGDHLCRPWQATAAPPNALAATRALLVCSHESMG